MKDNDAPEELVPQGIERLDLAVYAHRVLAVLRPLGPLECDVVLRAALELNRASLLRHSPTPSRTDEPA